MRRSLQRGRGKTPHVGEQARPPRTIPSATLAGIFGSVPIFHGTGIERARGAHFLGGAIDLIRSMACVQTAGSVTPVTDPGKFWRFAVGRCPTHASPQRFVEVAQHSTIDENAALMR